MGQSVPPERKDRSQKGDFPQSLRHYAGGRFVCAERCGGKAAAIAVSGPFGAVKERSSGLYAQRMAEYGFLTLAFDPSFTGESGGQPRFGASPDINVEDFCAAVDFLPVQDNADPARIGIIGICGWGGMAISRTGHPHQGHRSHDHVRYDPCQRQRLL